MTKLGIGSTSLLERLVRVFVFELVKRRHAAQVDRLGGGLPGAAAFESRQQAGRCKESRKPQSCSLRRHRVALE